MSTSLERFLAFVASEGAILDAGCGAGDDTHSLAARGFEVVGIDVDPAQLKQARAKTDQCVFRQMDARSLRYPTASFDGVWANGLLDQMTQAEARQTIRGFARVLKPGAPLFLNTEQTGYSVEDHGFRIVSEIAGPPRAIIAQRLDDPAADQQFEENCFLCPDARFSLNRPVDLPGPGSLLWGNEHLYLMPDIAPIVAGHLLLITTKHYMCYGACPPEMNQEILNAQQFVRELFATIYQTPTIFMEHGPAEKKRAGVCIEHAHWHCLPATLPMNERIKELLGDGIVAPLPTLQRMYQAKESYIYLEDAPGNGRAYLADVLPSQYLRQLAVSLLQRTDWEWQTTHKHPETQDLFRRTLSRLAAAIDERFK